MSKTKNKFTRMTGAHLVTRTALQKRADYSVQNGSQVQKWIQFCFIMMDEGFAVQVHEAETTFSKYITVYDYKNPKKRRKQFKVRFSNHRPNVRQERRNDSDFYVGVANDKTTTTEQAIAATLAHMRPDEYAHGPTHSSGDDRTGAQGASDERGS